MLDKEIKSPTEFINERGQTVLNNKSGSIVFDENTTQERLQLTHASGANLNFNNKTVSTFAPNNMQDLLKVISLALQSVIALVKRKAIKKSVHTEIILS